jgi:hypothetical protein
MNYGKGGFPLTHDLCLNMSMQFICCLSVAEPTDPRRTEKVTEISVTDGKAIN